MTTGIVILNYENYLDTIECIKSVFKFCSEEKFTIIVVDNGSKNNSNAKITEFLKLYGKSYEIIESNKIINKKSPEIVFIKSNENLGYAKGNNLGIKYVIQQNIEYTLILNSDILLISNIIKPLINHLKLQPKIGLISPLLMSDENNIDYNCCRINPTENTLVSESLQFLKIPILNTVINKKYILKTNPDLIKEELIKCDVISGACMLGRTNTWEQLNGFDENTFLYYEENILYEKLAKLNLTMALLTIPKVIHLGAKSTKQFGNTKILRIELESLLYYMKTYRSITPLKVIFIKAIRLFQIFILRLYNIKTKLI